MEEENNKDSFFKQQANKAKDMAKDEAKKQAKKKIISVILTHPVGALIVLGVLVATIILVVLLAGFEDIITWEIANDASNAKKAAVAVSLDSTTNTVPDTAKTVISKSDKGNYVINNNFTEDETNQIKQNIKESSINISKFSDFEIGVIGGLLNNRNRYR